jgi:glucose/arabinose dehydrogenase
MRIRSAAFLALALAAPAVLLGQSPRASATCDPDNGGLALPPGFCALVVAPETGGARHLAVAANGDVYVALRTADKPSGVVALRDTNGDGRADVRERFGDIGGTGLVLRNGYLYMAQDTAVVRFPMKDGQLLPTGPAETVVGGFVQQRTHATKTLTFDGRGRLYVNVGSFTNACTESTQPRAAGLSPCPQQEQNGGIWRFDANRIGQVFPRDGVRYMRGLRQTNALGWHPQANALYLVQHGLGAFAEWPEHFDEEQNAENPAEELLRVDEASTFSYPYCYYDRIQGKHVMAPAYGGDGQKVGDCAKYPKPLTAYPGHWAPNDLLFYTGDQFPNRYRGGAIIAFHGGAGRTPRPLEGFKVVFQPMRDGRVSGDYETLADGFVGPRRVMKLEEAQARPMGLAQGPDGSVYVSDSLKGRIWRVIYRGTPAR